MSDDFTAISGKKPVTFGKLKYLTTFLATMKRKMNQYFFFGGRTVNFWKNPKYTEIYTIHS